MVWIVGVLAFASGFALCWALFYLRILGVNEPAVAVVKKKKATKKKTSHPSRTGRGTR